MQIYNQSVHLEHNIKESNKIIKKVKSRSTSLTKTEKEFIETTRATSLVDMFFSMPVRND